MKTIGKTRSVLPCQGMKISASRKKNVITIKLSVSYDVLWQLSSVTTQKPHFTVYWIRTHRVTYLPSFLVMFVTATFSSKVDLIQNGCCPTISKVDRLHRG